MTEQSEGERLYILGHPVAHSKSPVMYNALYERLGLPWTYALADFAELDDARAFLDAREFLSVNITTPYKPLAFRELQGQARGCVRNGPHGAVHPSRVRYRRRRRVVAALARQGARA